VVCVYVWCTVQSLFHGGSGVATHGAHASRVFNAAVTVDVSLDVDGFVDISDLIE